MLVMSEIAKPSAFSRAMAVLALREILCWSSAALAFIQPISSAKPPNARKEGSRYLLFALVSSFAATPPVVCVADLSFWRVR